MYLKTLAYVFFYHYLSIHAKKSFKRLNVILTFLIISSYAYNGEKVCHFHFRINFSTKGLSPHRYYTTASYVYFDFKYYVDGH